MCVWKAPFFPCLRHPFSQFALNSSQSLRTSQRHTPTHSRGKCLCNRGMQRNLHGCMLAGGDGVINIHVISHIARRKLQSIRDIARDPKLRNADLLVLKLSPFEIVRSKFNKNWPNNQQLIIRHCVKIWKQSANARRSYDIGKTWVVFLAHLVFDDFKVTEIQRIKRCLTKQIASNGWMLT